jgi:iron complex outermembrane receptor protein
MIVAARRVAPLHGLALAGVLVVLQPGNASGQTQAPLRVPGSTVTVTAQKEPEDIQHVPASVTAVSKDTLTGEDLTTISDAGIFAPNTFFSDFQARKLSFPRFRGISSGPGNPAITTYVDGVPMIHTNASSTELLDVEQVEFVRGGQSALFGRNALGGIINVTSSRPSLVKWTGTGSLPFGNFGSVEGRGTVSGPLSGTSGLSVAAGRSVRDGYTTNDLNGQDVDHRGNTFGKAQLLWTPDAQWTTRIIVAGERARDGDYALSDLGAIRTTPFHVQRDFVGHTDRDVVSGTFLVRREGTRVTMSSTTGIVDWRAQDETDLDYSPPAVDPGQRRERDAVQPGSAFLLSAQAPSHVGAATLRWQTGVFFFTQAYDQDAVNTYSPFVLSPQVPFSVQQHNPTAALDDLGIGIYGQATFTLREQIDLALGARFDYENKDASLLTSFTPVIAPPTSVVGDRSSRTSRRRCRSAIVSSPIAWCMPRSAPDTSPADSIPRRRRAPIDGEEQTWQLEGGLKTTWANGRLLANAALFYINWDDLQLNLPNPQVPAQFYIANVGAAHSRGVESN